MLSEHNFMNAPRSMARVDFWVARCEFDDVGSQAMPDLLVI
jgi:hypothetical protein